MRKKGAFMEKSINNAFTYMFEDKDWIYKVSIFVLLSIPAAFYAMFQIFPEALKNILKLTDISPLVLLIVSVVMAVAALLANGYYCQIIKNIGNAKQFDTQELLPLWENDFFGYLKIGALLLAASFIAAAALLIPFILIIPAIIFALLKPALINIFCSEYNVTSFLAWRKAFLLIKQDTGFYVKIILASLAIFIVYLLIFLVAQLVFKPLVIIVLPFLTAYTQLVYAYLYGLLGQQRVESFENIQIVE